ncbi:peptidyl-prolyl cis-trans isomerase FKBP8-like isoform X2 [Gouania willdenowi]|nr:peptidyl-prolyl cis-trans isomerase FKBP8-like isoform X2 [Gouania willdenowi]XP_028297356.1 peptidyl-prolyl cis-trans isomerase FKBP8-like isoform X2 [Gouania willdenowi]
MKSGNKIVMGQSMRRETDPQPPADEWLDIFKNGVLMKKVLQAGGGRPHLGQIVKIHLITRLMKKEIKKLVSEEELSFTLGDGQVNQVLDVAVRLMGMGEKALFQVQLEAEFEITLMEATDAPDLKLLPPTEKIDLATCKREQGNVLDQHRDLKPRNNTIRDEVSTMMKKHSEDDEKMLENPSSTHKHQAMDEKMLENPSSTHKHQAMDEKMLENPSSTHKHRAMDEKMLEDSSSTHKHQAKSAWGLSWKWLLGATAVAIGGIALSVAIYARK